MPPINYLYIIIAVLAMMVGLYLITQWFLNRGNEDSDLPSVAYDKNGIPIIPRHERNLFDETDLDDAIAGETTIAPDRSLLKPVIEDSDNYADDSKLYTGEDDTHYMDDTSIVDLSAQDRGQHSDDHLNPIGANAHQDERTDYLNQTTRTETEYGQTEETSHPHDNEEDFFSTLASATENFAPVVETVDTPEFSENSPLLDQHLLAQADYDQNSPLNNAEENVNITLVPKQSFLTIDGPTILSLVEQYGLRYGAMNMFHRYENKDGTGILWFSMMGMTKDGIAPFDLNALPNSEYKGLVLFLSLPHPKALQGFDSMMSIVGLIAKQLDTHILDENNDPLTRERKQQLRTYVHDYQHAN